MIYQHIEVFPEAPAIGAEVRGVDLSKPVDADVFDEVHRAFLEHFVLFFRDQRITAAQLADFARRFGPLFIQPFVNAIAEHPEVTPVCKEADEVGYNFGVTWHTDASFNATPALGTMMQALEIPPIGGDTMFSNMYLAFDTLSPGMKRALEGMNAAHSGGGTYGPWGAWNRKRAMAGAIPDDEVEHPVVCVHPETGRKFLYVNRVFTTNFAGMTLDESRPLLEYLTEHVARPEFTCRFQWSDHAIALWDNRCTQHCAIDDYQGHRRALQRVIILGGPMTAARDRGRESRRSSIGQ